MATRFFSMGGQPFQGGPGGGGVKLLDPIFKRHFFSKKKTSIKKLKKLKNCVFLNKIEFFFCFFEQN
jgi:hypothetical protein